VDRDLNAAINLEQLAGSFLGQSQRSVRVASAGARRKPRVKLAAVKQEPNTRSGVSISG
jgi:hypothetical protein